MAPRYAIYFAPPPLTPLQVFGARILGYDATTKKSVPHYPSLVDQVANWRLLARNPARYGFHATFKAPFELAPFRTEAELLSELERTALQLGSIDLGALAVGKISDFIALLPRQTPAELCDLAQALVQQFDTFRAPMSDADRARRQPDRLTSRQRAYLEQWGYPFVLDEFRFHMTLAGPIEPRQIDCVRNKLQRLFRTEVADWDAPLTIDAMSVFKQPRRDEAFHVLSRHEFAGLVKSKQ
jgi:putative phosphonate metabolism protein